MGVAGTRQRVGWETERSVTLPQASQTNLGTALTDNPVIAIFDNQASVAVSVYANDILWKTFAAGSALVLDFRANNGLAPNFTPDIGTQFSISASGGTGDFKLSILNAR